MTYPNGSWRRLLRDFCRIGAVGSAVVTILWVASVSGGVGPSATAATNAGAAVVVSAQLPTTGQPLTTGGSATVFSLQLPVGAACTGDSVSSDYRVQSYMVPASVEPGSLTYAALGPIPLGTGADYRQPLFTINTQRYVNITTGPADTPGGGGQVPTIAPFDFAAAPFASGPSFLPPGPYNVGIACTRAGGSVLDKYWNVVMTFATDANDTPSGITWSVAEDIDETTTTTIGETTTTTIGETTTTTIGETTTTTIGETTTTTIGETTTTTIPPTTTTTVPATTTTIGGTTTTTPGGTTPGNASGVRGGFTVVKQSGPCIAVRNVAVSFGNLLAGSTDAAAGDATTVVSSCANQSLRVGVGASDAVSRAPATASLAVRRCAVSPTSPSSLQCGPRIGSKEFGYASAESANGSAFRLPQENNGARSRFFDLAPEASLTYQHYVQGPGSGASAQQFDFVITYTATAK